MKLLSLLILMFVAACSSDELNAPKEGRIALLQDEVEATVSLEGKSPIIPSLVINANWATVGGLPFRHLGNLAGPTNFDKAKWRRDIGDVVSGTLETTVQPIISGGYVFVINADADLLAINAVDGKVLWKKNLLLDEDEEANFRGGGIAAEGDYIFVTTGTGLIKALRAKDGTEIWSLNNHIPFTAAPTYADGKLYVIDRDNRLQVIDAYTGNVLWDHRGLPEILSASRVASPSIVGNVLVAPFSSGEINVFDLSRRRLAWKRNVLDRFNKGIAAFKTISAHPIIDQQKIFTGSVFSGLMAFHGATGRVAWEHESIKLQTTPLSSGDTLYVIDQKSRLVALRKADGKIFYISQLPAFEDLDTKEDKILWTSPLMLDDKIVTFSDHGQAIILDAVTGKQISSFDIEETMIDVSVANRTLYLLGENGYLYAYEM